MNTIVEKITEQLQNAFAECGYDRKYAKVSLSNRPDGSGKGIQKSTFYDCR